MDFTYTSVEIFGLFIEEPVTSFTDVISGMVGLVAFYRLQRLGLQDKAHILFKYYFLFMGLATVSGGVLGHAFQYIVGFNAKAIGWTLSAIGLFCLENSALSYYQRINNGSTLNKLRLLILLQLMTYLIFVINPDTRVFELVQINSVIGMIVISLPLFLYFYKKRNSVGSKRVVLGMFATFIPGLVYNNQITLHPYFNYQDISHLLMAGCIYLLYRGAKQIGLENEKQPNIKIIQPNI
jgi:hypothetical protein